MLLLQLASVPVPVRVGTDYELEIPRFKLRDVAALGGRLLQKWTDQQIDGMNASQKAQFLSLYPPISPNLATLKDAVRSSEGSEDVIKVSIHRARVFKLKPVVKRFRKRNGKPEDAPREVQTVERGDEITDPKELEAVRPKILGQILESDGGSGTLVYLAYEIADLDAKVVPPVAADDEEEIDTRPLA